MNRYLLGALSLLISHSVIASINLDSGISLEVLNGESVGKIEEVEFITGQNQLVVEYTGYLSERGKREFFSSIPYILVVDVPAKSELEIKLISKKFSEIKSYVDKKKPIFSASIDGNVTELKQQVLPPAEGVFPYGDIPELVKNYNQEQGLVFDSGKIRSLKKELAIVQTVSIDQDQHTIQESETSLQLKIWYSKASKEEKKEFKRWMIEQD
ncbi:DUF2057 family protein [Vibrio sp. RE88]|uniref:DUF2057 family protein n=1 Tax=Vibrio sp. RE88 TaxID=2607610 RepID=UPI0014937072|nr:DUF2057 family protein [Vibrio sp. RE88]NOH62976.1 DUF2057 domain-containing protein [Vibrio sp. RE88]